MYKYYCKDPQCPGHTKSWERCCDLRAFAPKSVAAPWSGKSDVTHLKPKAPKPVFA